MERFRIARKGFETLEQVAQWGKDRGMAPGDFVGKWANIRAWRRYEKWRDRKRREQAQ